MTPKRTTERNRQRFLKAYAQCGIVAAASRLANVARSEHYVWMQDPNYQRAFAEAREEACDEIEAECFRRALHGTEEPVIWKGQLCYKKDEQGRKTNIPLTITRYSSEMLMFMLKAWKPEKYRDNWKAEIAHSGSINRDRDPDLITLTDEQLHYLRNLAAGSHNGNGSAETLECNGGEDRTETTQDALREPA